MFAVIASVAMLLLSGCYNQKKATIQHGKAVATFPVIGADYCARVYPSKDSLIKGDSVVIRDTVQGVGTIKIDTVFKEGKPVEILKVITLPGQTIRELITRVDTVEKESTRLLAALDLARINLGKSMDALAVQNLRADKYQKQAKVRLWILIAIGAVAGLLLFFRLRSRK